jgi:aspartate racemase
VQARTPPIEDQELIQQITFDQLVKGVFTEAAREQFTHVIAKLSDVGCDAVALVCTEFPLLITPERSPLPRITKK